MIESGRFQCWNLIEFNVGIWQNPMLDSGRFQEVSFAILGQSLASHCDGLLMKTMENCNVMKQSLGYGPIMMLYNDLFHNSIDLRASSITSDSILYFVLL